MGIWKDLTAYVLLAHLVTLSRGSSAGKVALEEILVRNGSIVVIEDKADGPVDLGKLINVTSVTPGYNNSSVSSNKTEVVDENELLVELEEALVSAASSGQVIMIAPPANNGNSTRALLGPVIVIETSANKLKSLVKDTPSHKKKSRKATSLNLDQDVAQSQTRQTVGPQNYTDDEDLETLGDLLAITEYEPQRIDAKGIDGKISEATSGKLNSTLQSLNHPRPEDTHYDVPRQRIQSRNHQRTSDNSKKVINKVSTEGPIQAAPSNLRPIQTDRRTTTPSSSKHKVERRKSTTNLDQTPTLTHTEIPRKPNNSEIIIPLTTKPTVARKLSYSEIEKRNNLLGAPSSFDTTSTFVPGLSESTTAHSKSAHNFTTIANQPRKTLHSARVQTTPVPLPSTHYPFLQQQASSVSAKTSSQPTLITSAVPRASRRIDDYSSLDYVTKSIEELQSLTNQPLGYLTRYNLPSLVPRRILKTQLHPAASEYKQTETPKETPEEIQSDEEHNYEGTSSKSPGTVIPLHGSYDNTRQRLSRTRTTSRPSSIDYQKVYRNDNQQPVIDYRKAYQTETSKETPEDKKSDDKRSYEVTSPKSSGTVIPLHSSYDNTRQRLSRTRTTSRPSFIDYQKTYQNDNQQPVIDYQKAYQIETSKEIPEDKKSDDERSYEDTSPKSSETVIPLHSSYDNTRQRLSRTRTTSRPPFIDYHNAYQNDNQQPAVDYRKAHQWENQRASPDYPNDNPRPIPDYQKGNQRPVLDYRKAHQKLNQEPITDYQNDRRSLIVKTTPTYDSYEEDGQQSSATPKSEELRSSEVTSPQTRNEIYPRKRNSLVVSTTTPAYDSYEDEETEKPKVQLQRFAPTGHQRQRETTNPYLVPRQVYQPYNYPKTSQPTTSNSLLDNPIYQLHGVKTSPGLITPNAIYNPLQNYQERRPSASTTPLRRQNSRYVPYGTSTSQRIVTTTAASDSYENSEETTRPPVTTQRLRNSNYVSHHDVKPVLNIHKNNQKSEVTTLTPTRKSFTDYNYKKPINNQNSLYQTKPITQLTSRASYNPERNSDRNYASDEVTTSTYAENSRSNEDESNDRSYVPAATKLQTFNHPNKLERQNSAIRTTLAPKYESYEDGNVEDRLSPNGNDKLIESYTANYGNRVRPRVGVEEKRYFVPSYTHAALTTPGHSRDVQSNYGGRRRTSVHVEEEPVESVHRTDVEAAPYEDEVSASSGHAEDQATHQTHAKAKKHGDGGHKHEEGGGVKHEEDHHESHGEKGDKGYKGYHEYDKGSKGHHDKEDHNKEYDEKKGEKKKHEDEGGYHKEHHHGEKGDKEAEFAEKGEHQKGHSTKGQHVVHKKDEYEKKTEFYDESHEEDGDEKDGEYHHEHEHKKGGHEKKGHHDSADHEDKYGKKGEHEKGHHYHEKKGHDGKDGKDQHHHHHEKYGKKGGHEEGLKWSHKKGDDGHGKEKGS